MPFCFQRCRYMNFIINTAADATQPLIVKFLRYIIAGAAMSPPAAENILEADENTDGMIWPAKPYTVIK